MIQIILLGVLGYKGCLGTHSLPSESARLIVCISMQETFIRVVKRIIKPIRTRRSCSRHDKIAVKIDTFLQRGPLLSPLSVHVVRIST